MYNTGTDTEKKLPGTGGKKRKVKYFRIKKKSTRETRPQSATQSKGCKKLLKLTQTRKSEEEEAQRGKNHLLVMGIVEKKDKTM